MHQAKPYGHLVRANGQRYSTQDLARSAGCSVDEAQSLLQELIDNGVPSVTADGVVYSRRMVREADLSQKRSEAGRKGGLAPKQGTKQRGKQNESKREANTQANSGYGYGNGALALSSSLGEEDGGTGEGEVAAPVTLRFDLTPAGLAQAWCFYCTRRRRGEKADVAQDLTPSFSELLRSHADHVTEEAILREIERPQRDKDEHFWQFKQRILGGKSGKPKRKSYRCNDEQQPAA